MKDEYFLDKSNRIIVILDNDIYQYKMVHQRLIDGKYINIKKWAIKPYYYDMIHYNAVIEDLNFFQVQNANGGFEAWYDYKNGKFIIEPGIWDEISLGTNNEYIDKYNGAIANFTIKSDYENDDIIKYESAIDGKEKLITFEVNDGKYFAILNLDGTIRNNVLFKGQSIYEINQIIYLSQYHSLEDFKQRRKMICNALKKERKEQYYTNDYSQYIDKEVARVLKK